MGAWLSNWLRKLILILENSRREFYVDEKNDCIMAASEIEPSLVTLFIKCYIMQFELNFLYFFFIQRSGSYFLYLEAYASWMLIQELA